jgi:hypothetical protein
VFPKNLIHHHRYRIVDDDGFGDMLSYSSVHANDGDGVNYRDSTASREGKTLVFGCVVLFSR